MMDATQQVAKFKEFFEEISYKDLLKATSKGDKFISISFTDLAKFHVQLAEDLLEDPENVLQAATHTIEQMDLGDTKGFEVRFYDLPKTSCIMTRNIRSKHIGKFLQLEGIVRQKSDVRPQVTSARFECPSCGNIIPVLQLDQKFKEPFACGCGRKGQFRLIHKELVDAQKLVLEEAPEEMEGGEQPKRLDIFLRKDLVSPITDKKTNPGSKIRLTGIVKEVPITLHSGGKSTRFDLICEANYVEPVQEEFTNLVFSDEEIDKIKELSQDPQAFEKLTASLAPTIYGHDRIKEALLLQLLGGVRKKSDDGVQRRGDMHILLIGDPGSGKCGKYSTKVQLANGDIVSIKELVDENLNCEDVQIPLFGIDFTGEVNKQKGVRVWRRKENQLLKITLRSGKYLEVTKNHPLFYSSDGFIVAKEAKDFLVGERIATPRIISVDASIQSIPLYSPKYAKNQIKYSFPTIVNKNLARFVGFICGDGYVSSKYYVVVFTNADNCLLADITSIFADLFGRKIIPNKRKNINAKDFIINSKAVNQYFRQNFNGLCGGAANKNIPKLILKSPNNILAEFIKGLFECDAHVNPKKRQIEFATISKELAENIQYVLLRYGIVALLKEKKKIAKNTKSKRVVQAYEVVISGEFVKNYYDHIGFVSEKKKIALQKIIDEATYYNTNLDVVPGVNNLLKKIRTDQDLKQKEMNMPRSSYAHYDQDNRMPSVKTLRKLSSYLSIIDPNSVDIAMLDQIAHSDVYWDEIISIEEIENDEEYVYDLEVANTHNYVANGTIVHNSQMIRRMSIIAPKARFVSGKGASGAGLCVSPTSMVCTNPGGIDAISNVVESSFENPQEYRPGVWKQEDVTSVKIQSLSEDMKLHAKHPEAVWKLDAPKNVFRVTLTSGKQIELTANTKLFSIDDGVTSWKKSSNLCVGDYIATPRKLIGGNVSKQSVIPLLDSNPVIHNIKPFVKKVVLKLKRKYGSIRMAAKHLSINENQLYHNWVNENARGNIKLSSLKKICDDISISFHKCIKKVSLYNGKAHTLPKYLSKDFLYVAGLIAGDGDMRRTPVDGISVRLSNSENSLLDFFTKTVSEEFSLSYDIQLGNHKRPPAARFSSKLLGEILISLGISLSPKSSKVFFSQILLHLDNDLLASFIAGIYDADGSVYIRKKGKGSSAIEYTTTSETFARQLQIVFLRYAIQARLRKRKAVCGKIKSKHDKWVVTIYGISQIKEFARLFKLKHPRKKANLADLCKLPLTHQTNVDIVPGVSIPLKEKILSMGLSLKKTGWRPDFSRHGLKDFLRKNNLSDSYLNNIAHSDVFWDRVASVEMIEAKYDFVYDLTVKDSHNFVVDGVLVHNTASVVKDEFLKGWALEAGALVLANKGIACLDEMDKMSQEDTSALHEALEQQTVTISKANIQATLRCETTVLAAANPKFGRFDPYELIAKQIELPSTLINRFDLIFPVRDLPDESRDAQMASFILNLHRGRKNDKDEEVLDTDFLRKYLAYAKQHAKPKLTDDALQEIQRYYVKMRNQGGGEGGVSAVPISARQLEALVRLSEASAKVRLSETVAKKDAQRAIDMVHHCLSQIGMDPDTGKLDIDRITTGITASQRSNITLVKEVINELEKAIGKIIPEEDIIRESEIKGVSEEKATEILTKLVRTGDLFNPKNGFVSKVR